jgi:hypothetical protein
MLPSRSVPRRLDSLRVMVTQAIGEATTVIANQAWCSVAIAGVRKITLLRLAEKAPAQPKTKPEPGESPASKPKS